MSMDNILVDKRGTAHRIDTGGALTYRAQGAPKKGAWNEGVNEFESLRDGTNPQSAKIFGKMSNEDVARSANHVVQNQEKLFQALPAELHPMMKKRLKSLAAKSAALSPTPQKPATAAPATPAAKPVTPAFSPPAPTSADSTSHPHLSSASKLAEYAAPKFDSKSFKAIHVEKMKFLNPNGIANNTFFLPVVGQHNKDLSIKTTHMEHVEQAKKFLPLGTKIVGVWVGGKDAKDFKIQSLSASDHSKAINSPVAPTVKPASATPVSTPTTLPPTVFTGGFTQPPLSAPLAVSIPEPHSISPRPPLPPSVSTTSFTPAQIADSTLDAVVKWKASMTSTEEHAVTTWKNSARITKEKIAADPPPPPADKKAAAFMTAISKAPIVQGTVYRGIKGQYAKDTVATILMAGMGGIWEETTPHCTSRSKTVANRFGGHGMLFVITTKTGRSIEHYGSHADEKEVVGMPSKYKITKITVRDHQAKADTAALKSYTFHMEEI